MKTSSNLFMNSINSINSMNSINLIMMVLVIKTFILFDYDVIYELRLIRRNMDHSVVLNELESQGISIRLASPKLVVEEVSIAFKSIGILCFFFIDIFY